MEQKGLKQGSFILVQLVLDLLVAVTASLLVEMFNEPTVDANVVQLRVWQRANRPTMLPIDVDEHIPRVGLLPTRLFQTQAAWSRTCILSATGFLEVVECVFTSVQREIIRPAVRRLGENEVIGHAISLHLLLQIPHPVSDPGPSHFIIVSYSVSGR
jgi:hypothetical protein